MTCWIIAHSEWKWRPVWMSMIICLSSQQSTAYQSLVHWVRAIRRVWVRASPTLAQFIHIYMVYQYQVGRSHLADIVISAISLILMYVIQSCNINLFTLHNRTLGKEEKLMAVSTLRKSACNYGDIQMLPRGVVVVIGIARRVWLTFINVCRYCLYFASLQLLYAFAS